MRCAVIWFYVIVALVRTSLAADFSFVGAFAQDDERRQFTFTLNQAGTVVLRTWSYAGGVNSTGARIDGGGFDPSLSLFDSTGLLLVTNRDGGCNRVAADRITSVGVGPDRPIADNKSAEGRANNRRVEIIVQPPKK